MTVTAVGAWFSETVVSSRAPTSSVAPAELETIARPTAPSPGSGSSTTAVSPGRGAGGMRFGPQPAASPAANSGDQNGKGSRVVHSTRRRQRGAADAHHGGRGFEANGVGRELGDPAGDVRHDAADDVEHESHPTLGGSEHESIDPYFAAGADGNARIVFQRDAEATVGAGPQGVRLEHHLRRPGQARSGASPHDERGAGCDLDAARRTLRLLGQSRCRRGHDHQGAKPDSKSDHAVPLLPTISLFRAAVQLAGNVQEEARSPSELIPKEADHAQERGSGGLFPGGKSGTNVE